MILILRNKATRQQVEEMLEELDPLVKFAVDIKRKIWAGGGEMHSDWESVLLEDGSCQKDIWDANWIPVTQTIEFEALINIRPKQQNRSMIIQDPVIKQQIEIIVRKLLEGE